MTSVELRITHDYRIETDWGIIEHPTPDPVPDQPGHFVVGHLLLIDSRMVAELLTIGVPLTIPEGIAGAYLADLGVFFCLVDHNDQRFVWELHPAHWFDGGGPHGLLCGVWRD